MGNSTVFLSLGASRPDGTRIASHVVDSHYFPAIRAFDAAIRPPVKSL